MFCANDLRRDGVMRWQFTCISVEDQVRPQGGGGGEDWGIFPGPQLEKGPRRPP